MTNLIFNGQIRDAAEALIPVDDRGFLLGDGAFETARAYQGKVFRLPGHLGRLFRSCEEIQIRIPWTQEEIAGMTADLIRANGLDDARVRITLSRGKHTGAMGLASASSPTLLITAEPIPAGLDSRRENGIKLMTADVRFSENNPIFRHKTLNRLPHLIARAQAESAGYDEALVLDERGNVACCSTGNIFAVQYGQLFTPPLQGPVLPGITRAAVLELARADGMPIREDFFSPLMLAGADEVFMTNSVHEIVPAIKVNNHLVGSGRPGPVARGLCKRYQKLTEENYE